MAQRKSETKSHGAVLDPPWKPPVDSRDRYDDGDISWKHFLVPFIVHFIGHFATSLGDVTGRSFNTVLVQDVQNPTFGPEEPCYWGEYIKSQCSLCINFILSFFDRNGDFFPDCDKCCLLLEEPCHVRPFRIHSTSQSSRKATRGMCTTCCCMSATSKTASAISRSGWTWTAPSATAPTCPCLGWGAMRPSLHGQWALKASDQSDASNKRYIML